MRKLVISSLIVISFLLTSSAQAKTPEELTSDFFKILPENPKNAVDRIITSNLFIKQEVSQVNSLKTLISNYPNLKGDYKFNEKICRYKIGENLESITYLVGYEQSPMLFDFFFYRVNGNWKIINMNTDNFDQKSILNKKEWCEIK
ncbi:TPA: hypothetical protein P0E27_000297 [Vibrio harveyi]|nr:hypothetical protein [Vibrio harveyi]